jgi:hypothetical protein
LLQAENEINNIGDGGISDGEGERYDCVHSFQDGMKEVEREHLDHDTDEIEHCVEANDDDAIVRDEPNMVPSALPGAPTGWSPPTPPDNWNPTVNLLKGEPPFDEVDNPGNWSSFTNHPLFQPKRGYMCHAMPAGATAVPVDKLTGKRQAGDFEFFYHGWKQENPTKDNCKFGASRDLLFPPDRQVQLDFNYMKKIGLTWKRMLECDALFFYKLLLPIVDPAVSGINEDPCMGYYEEVAKIPTCMHLERRTEEEPEGIFLSY